MEGTLNELQDINKYYFRKDTMTPPLMMSTIPMRVDKPGKGSPSHRPRTDENTMLEYPTAAMRPALS